MLLRQFPPMGVYETLFKFQDATGQYMGDAGTHPWAQGFPVTKKLPDGPDIPTSITFNDLDLKYPAASGVQGLRETIADYYNHFYKARITADHVTLFAGGRPGLLTTLLLLQQNVTVLIEETEYTPYYDKLKLLNRKYELVPSHEGNRFRPTLDNYAQLRKAVGGPTLAIRSNPCNPTGVTWSGDDLQQFVSFASTSGHGAIIDEAYEFFSEVGAVSAMEYIKNIDDTNLFVVGAATKGLQAPGARVGWVIASRQYTELFRNYSSLGMGGISRLSQILVTQLMQRERMKSARKAVQSYYDHQRDRYRKAFEALDLQLFTGNGGFYHWLKLPQGLSADQWNVRLFKDKAAVLPGHLCDMKRTGPQGTHGNFARFSFGPLDQGSFANDMDIIKRSLKM